MLLLLLPVAILLVCFIMGHVCWNIGVVQSFEPNPDHSPDAGTGLLSPIAYALQRGILLRWYWAPVEAATRDFEASKHRCRR